MKNSILLLALIAMSGSLFSQEAPDRSEQKMDRMKHRNDIKAMRVAFLTSNMDLRPEEAEKFWPINNEFEEKKRELRAPIKKIERSLRAKGPENASDQELIDLMNMQLEFKLKMVELERSYQKRYLEVIPAQKLAKYYFAEERFKKHLMQKMREEGHPHEGKKGLD